MVLTERRRSARMRRALGWLALERHALVDGRGLRDGVFMGERADVIGGDSVVMMLGKIL